MRRALVHSRLLVDQRAVGTDKIVELVVVRRVLHEVAEFAPKPLGHRALNQAGASGTFVKDFHSIIGRVIDDVHLRTVEDDGHGFLQEDLSVAYLGLSSENARPAVHLMP